MNTIANPVIWGYLAGAAVLLAGLATVFLSGAWHKAGALDRLLLLAPLAYAAPLAAFGSEHFTLTRSIAPMVPAWIPWPLFWTYFVGTCFILAAVSLATRIQIRLAASLLALNFFAFVLLMDAPAWVHHPDNRFALALLLRELALAGGPLALAASLSKGWRKQYGTLLGRYFVAVAVLFYGIELFLHGNYVPAVPLNRITPTWIFGHAVWTYATAAVYVAAGIPLLLGKRTRSAAACIGLAAFAVVLFVYVPIGIVDRASIAQGLDYLGDTVMFCGTVWLLAAAMPGRQEAVRPPAAAALQAEDERQGGAYASSHTRTRGHSPSR
ncbi:MAG: hypothetical protein ACRD1C_03520 [Terriglobales bacterium]